MAPREPRAAALAYAKTIRDRLEAFEREVDRILSPALETFAAGNAGGATSEAEDPGASPRVDARIPSYLAAKLGVLELRLIEIFDEGDLEDALDVIGKRVASKNKTELLRVIGISIRDADPGVAAMIDSFRAINVSRIKSLAGSALVDITKLLETSEATGARVEVLRKAIQDTFGVTKSKAALLARDQTLTLNSQIARVRQQNLGIDRYIWTTSGDERVRETHADLDGTIQSWQVPPIISEDGRTGHPGDDYQCRCTAFPLLPELDDT